MLIHIFALLIAWLILRWILMTFFEPVWILLLILKDIALNLLTFGWYGIWAGSRSVQTTKRGDRAIADDDLRQARRR